MDRTDWLYQPRNSLKGLLALILLVASACEQGDVLEREPRVAALSSIDDSVSSRSEVATQKQQNSLEVEMKPEDDKAEAAKPYPSEYVDAMLKKTFGDQVRHTEDELKVITFVDKHVDKSGVQITKPRRHLVSKRDDVWVVTVMSLQRLQQPGVRDGSLVIHVSDKNGQFSVVKQEAN